MASLQAAALGLAATPVGSWRRGRVGGHDVDVLLHDANEYVRIADYAWHDPRGRGNVLLARFWDAVDDAAPPGFLLRRYNSSGGDIFQQDGKGTSKLATRHTFIVSPTVRPPEWNHCHPRNRKRAPVARGIERAHCCP